MTFSITYQQMRQHYPAYRRGDRVMVALKGTSAEDMPRYADVSKVSKNGEIYVHGASFGMTCREEDLTPVAEKLNGDLPGIYRHYKGPLYLVIGTEIDATTDQERVVYRPMYPCDKGQFSRTPEDFHGTDKKSGAKRFIKIANR